MSKKIRMLLLCILMASAAMEISQGQVIRRGGVVLPTLKQQLNTGLLARTPDEREFNDKVVALVDQGKLPLSLVQSTFLWARDKQPYPMPFFEQALRIRAQKIGVKL